MNKRLDASEIQTIISTVIPAVAIAMIDSSKLEFDRLTNVYKTSIKTVSAIPEQVISYAHSLTGYFIFDETTGAKFPVAREFPPDDQANGFIYWGVNDLGQSIALFIHDDREKENVR